MRANLFGVSRRVNPQDLSDYCGPRRYGQQAAPRCELRRGDRIFVRAEDGARTLCNLCLENVATISEVIGEVRHALRAETGLVKLTVRNYDRGWCQQRNLRLYGEFPAPRCHGSAPGAYTPTRGRSMLMPWETH